MKNLFVRCALAIAIIACTGTHVFAGEMDVLVNKLVEKGVLTPAEAQIVIEETRVQMAKDLSQAKAITAPEWTQRIKWGGDVRFRTQGDWAKNNTANAGNNGIENQRIRQRIRGRFWMQGKVNDFTTAGVRFAGGNTNSRSTNDTLDDWFEKDFVMFDQYWMRFDAPAALREKYGCYFDDMQLWAGKFSIPFKKTELTWDSDINPEGIAFQYTSPAVSTGLLPDLNIYSNIGMFWLDEQATYNTDPLLFGYQLGAKTDAFGPCDSKLNAAVTWYDFANIQNKAPNAGATAGTNSRWVNADFANPNSNNSPLLNTLKYEYNVFDVLLELDNTSFFGCAFPHGLYTDMIFNTACHDPSTNKGFLFGAYLGKKKVKKPGDWKARAEWRYIERDAIPDFMPDSDFYGFGTRTANNAPMGVNGQPAGGGTNGKGVNMAFEYQLFKNTSLNLEYYWMKPIKSWDKQTPWNEFQFDVITKF